MSCTINARAAALMGGLLVAACTVAHGPTVESDPVLGTWDLDVAHSAFRPGPPVRRQTRTYTQTPGGVRFILEGISAAGTPVRNEYTAPYDGHDHPLTGVPRVNTVALRRVSRLETDAVEKKDGVIVFRVSRLIAADGKTMTITVYGKTAEGQPMTNVLVFRRR